MFKKSVALAAFATVALAGVAEARDRIHIVGSSTVFPFSTSVAEQFGKSTSFKTPVVESTGSGGGLKLFCAGVGAKHPDITNASRRIKKSEIETCAKNGVTDITEIKIGFDGVAFANSKKAPVLNVTLEQIFLALAKDVPGASGNLVKNPYKMWSDIDQSLPNKKIEVLGPPPTSGTRDAWSEFAMEGGAKKIPALAALRKQDKKAFVKIAHAMREDGAYIEAGENDNLIVQKLDVNPNAFGIFGFSFLDNNSDKLRPSMVDGVSAEFENIAAGDYPVSRSMYFYVKMAHVGVVPGIKEYVAEFTSDRTFGEDGYLVDKGLIPLSAAELQKVQADARNLKDLNYLSM